MIKTDFYILLKITLFSDLFFFSPIKVSALALDWNFNNSEDYIYDPGLIKLSDGMAIYNSQKTNQANIKTPIASIQPISSLKALNIIKWTGFTETANKNGGDIYYQLSDDDGQTWYYWDDLNWTEAGEHDYNEAAIINNQMKNFQAGSGQIKFEGEVRKCSQSDYALLVSVKTLVGK